MFTLVIYDIPEDKIRNRLAGICKDFGLKRIQFSAFCGDLSFSKREELFLRLKKAAGNKEANIHLYSLCERDLNLARRHINISGGKDE
ncbi:MAG: CRISPR-associated endonuclease Cas2 [Caldiserica bacterium]|jgi:CRISPR-associated protein Cas2|nr:CRISPR-associated endonuclease Cas2 [Caldisericota bacterium]MDH7562828.1 CRISPR-associated endonuclease Cas2 [Caldisericota bacterium]